MNKYPTKSNERIKNIYKKQGKTFNRKRNRNKNKHIPQPKNEINIPI